jgi:hypothetical protein
MPRRCDLWRVGIVHAPVEHIARSGLSADIAVTWLDTGRSFTFDADPFAIWHEGHLHLFVEHYDYRTRHGVIDRLEFDRDLQLLGRTRALTAPWHLSYPQIFEAEGSFWMLPEACRSGALTLYRSTSPAGTWEAVCQLDVGQPAIDATIVRHDERWWLFFSSARDRLHRMGSLHAAWADALEGPWHRVGDGPIRLDLTGSRPGGRPFVMDGEVVLPTQDCSRTYGGAIQLLHLERLDPEGIAWREGRRIGPNPIWAPYAHGLHTLSGSGPVTLIDAKSIDRTGRGWLIDAARLFSGKRAPTRAA